MLNNNMQPITVVCRLDGRNSYDKMLSDAVKFAQAGAHAGFDLKKGTRLVRRYLLKGNGNVVEA
jgi:hypothetical protein